MPRAAYNKLYGVDPELAQAAMSFRTDEGDTAFFQNTSFGTMELLADITNSPFHRLDTSYARRLDFERGVVESDYLFTFVPSRGLVEVLPGPHETHYLHWNLELDARNVNLVRDEVEGVYTSVFIASVEITPREDENVLVVNDRSESFMSLREQQVEAALQSPFSYSGMTPLIPGAYRMRIVLRNRACPSRAESDCQKSYTLFEQEVHVPDWPERPELARIVLAYDTEMIDGAALYRPFRFGNLQLLPTPEAVFAIGDRLVVSTGALHPPQGAQVRFRVRDVDGVGRVWLDETVPVVEGPMVQELRLDGLEGGRFELSAALIGADGVTHDNKTARFTVSPRTALVRPAVRGYIPSVRPEVPGVVALGLGEQFLRVRDDAKARAELETALAENFQLAPAREHLGSLSLESGEIDRAIELVSPVVQHMPDRFEALSVLGEAYFAKGDSARVVELLERALTLRRGNPKLLNALARSHAELGNTDRASELLSRSLAMDPDQEAIRELLDQIKSTSPDTGS